MSGLFQCFSLVLAYVFTPPPPFCPIPRLLLTLSVLTDPHCSVKYLGRGKDKVRVWTCRGIGLSTCIYALEHARAKISMVEIYFKVFVAAYCTLGFLLFHGVRCTPEIPGHFLLAQRHICLIHTSLSVNESLTEFCPEKKLSKKWQPQGRHSHRFITP